MRGNGTALTHAQLPSLGHRPDSYIGSTEALTDNMWVFDEGVGFNNRKVTYVPGLYKVCAPWPSASHIRF